MFIPDLLSVLCFVCLIAGAMTPEKKHKPTPWDAISEHSQRFDFLMGRHDSGPSHEDAFPETPLKKRSAGASIAPGETHVSIMVYVLLSHWFCLPSLCVAPAKLCKIRVLRSKLLQWFDQNCFTAAG